MSWRCLQPGKWEGFGTGTPWVKTQAGVGGGERQRPRDAEIGKETGTRGREIKV